MTTRSADAPYTLRHIEAMLGLSRSVISGLIDAGFVTPLRGARNQYHFTFQDVVLLRTAYHLRASNIPARRMLRSLKQLKSRLPEALPLSGLRITAIGNDVVVRDGDAHVAAETGQLLMDFEVASRSGSVAFLPPIPTPSATAVVGAADWFRRGECLEAEDPAAAEEAYRRTLAMVPNHAYAYVNLGAMLCEAGRCEEAVQLYDRALPHCPDSAPVHFNRAMALEDLQRDREALASYERCLVLDPNLADAHYNAARLHEKLGQAQRALRHYSAYRRLQQDGPVAPS